MFIRRWQGAAAMVAIAAGVVVSAIHVQGQQSARGPDWRAVEDVFGFHGDVLPDDVIRFNMPRSDLHVTLGGTEIKPGLALGAWAAFHAMGAGHAMVMGDLVLTDEEVAPVMKALQDGGVKVTALHNHLIGESPRIMYVHMGGQGDTVKMAQTIKKAVALTKTPTPRPASATTQTETLSFDVPEVEKIIGRKGRVSGGVWHLSVPRAEKLTEEGMETPASMGAGTSVNLQPTGPGRAAVAGDFAMTAKEVEPVMKALRESGIESVALHSHALDDAPRLFYLHVWANDDATKIAQGLRRALDQMNSAPRVYAAR